MDPDWTFRWKDVEADFPCDELHRLEADFLTDFYESVLETHPEDTEVLIELGEIYTADGRFEEGLAVDRLLARLLPDDPTVLYNLACSQALTGDGEGAVRSLSGALRKGFHNFDHLEEDEDLASIRHTPEFKALIQMTRKALSPSPPHTPPRQSS